MYVASVDMTYNTYIYNEPYNTYSGVKIQKLILYYKLTKLIYRMKSTSV